MNKVFLLKVWNYMSFKIKHTTRKAWFIIFSALSLLVITLTFYFVNASDNATWINSPSGKGEVYKWISISYFNQLLMMLPLILVTIFGVMNAHSIFGKRENGMLDLIIISKGMTTKQVATSKVASLTLLNLTTALLFGAIGIITGAFMLKTSWTPSINVLLNGISWFVASFILLNLMASIFILLDLFLKLVWSLLIILFVIIGAGAVGFMFTIDGGTPAGHSNYHNNDFQTNSGSGSYDYFLKDNDIFESQWVQTYEGHESDIQNLDFKKKNDNLNPIINMEKSFFMFNIGQSSKEYHRLDLEVDNPAYESVSKIAASIKIDDSYNKLRNPDIEAYDGVFALKLEKTRSDYYDRSYSKMLDNYNKDKEKYDAIISWFQANKEQLMTWFNKHNLFNDPNEEIPLNQVDGLDQYFDRRHDPDRIIVPTEQRGVIQDYVPTDNSLFAHVYNALFTAFKAKDNEVITMFGDNTSWLTNAFPKFSEKRNTPNENWFREGSNYYFGNSMIQNRDRKLSYDTMPVALLTALIAPNVKAKLNVDAKVDMSDYIGYKQYEIRIPEEVVPGSGVKYAFMHTDSQEPMLRKLNITLMKQGSNAINSIYVPLFAVLGLTTLFGAYFTYARKSYK